MKMGKVRTRGFAHWKLIVGLLLVVVLVGVAVWRATRIAASMSVIAGSAKDLQQAAPDVKTKIVVEVADANGQRLIHGTLLEKKTEELYARTKTTVNIQTSAETKMVMGTSEDVKNGAVIHITGQVTGHITGTARAGQTIVAEQIVILTNYVKVTE